MTEFVDFYAILDLESNVAEEAIKAAWRREAKKFHPDMNPDDSGASAVRFRLITEAYETLIDPVRRRKYDAIWRTERGIDMDSGAGAEENQPGQVSTADWDFAVRYFPRLIEISGHLKRLSPKLEVQWRNKLFFDRTFTIADETAAVFENVFLAELVGNSDVLRMVYRDALLAGHDRLIGELKNAIRLFGLEQAEKMIAEICSSCLAFEKTYEGDIDENNHGEVIRTERYNDVMIEIHQDLACSFSVDRKSYTRRWKAYLFEARREIDIHQPRKKLA